MTPEISLLEAELAEAHELVKSRRQRLQMAKDAHWTDHFRALGVVEGETVVIAKPEGLWHAQEEYLGVIRWTNRAHPCIIRRNRDGSVPRVHFNPIRLKEIVKCC